ncbi:bromodomain and WD repeat-containing DDB_G0285837 [Drosophila innubila]|uniref:bromodomain and WD repeat-containing DDB_G0285837 n=1 Tax=Drosophila innubila TaxID=198719 RepID=UPI00148BD921|nr:bromodomain and WD repeat-containing DDB_G0285837 [Drosophila innubila]
MQWIFAIVLCLWASGIAEARQIRINRYAASVQEDDVQQAEVKELKPTPYPAAGYRPQGRAFWLPGEEGSGFGADQVTTTTEMPVDDAITSTTESLDLSTTTVQTTTLDNLDVTTTTATPLVEFRSGRAYEKAPYPAAGYRPSRAFLLPTELNLDQQQQQQQREQQQQQKLDSSNADPFQAAEGNENHPVCGVSTNPLMPTPEPGSKDEPDAESVVITANLGPAVLVARTPATNGLPVAIPLRSQPLIQAPRRGFVYTTHVERRW